MTTLKKTTSGETPHTNSIIVRNLELEQENSLMKEAIARFRESEAFFRSIFNTAADGIINIDESGIIRLINDAALEIFGYEMENLIGRSFEIFIPDYYKKQHRKFVKKHFDGEARKVVGKVVEVIGKRKDGSEFPLELRVSEMALGYERKFSLIVRNITVRKYVEAERENLIRDLKDALENIKTLKGMIPICASCKKIRDDQGYWKGVESYFSEHVDVDFSHSICPECMVKLYPDFLDDEEDTNPL